MIALTFDDGPGPMTLQILDSLRSYGIKATFFVVGRNIEEAPWSDISDLGRSIVKRTLLDGHTIGNHTYSHSREIQGEIEFRREIEKTDTLISELSSEVGLSFRIPPLRLPFGTRAGDHRLQYIGAIGRPHLHWSMDFNDWSEGPNVPLFPEIVAYVEERERMGLNSVLDLHDGGIGGNSGYERPATVDAVQRLVDEASTRGWEFFRVPSLA